MQSGWQPDAIFISSHISIIDLVDEQTGTPVVVTVVPLRYVQQGRISTLLCYLCNFLI